MFTELVKNAPIFQWEKANNSAEDVGETADSLKEFTSKFRFRLEDDPKFRDISLSNKLARISEFCYKSITPAALTEFHKKIVNTANKELLHRMSICFFIFSAAIALMLLRIGISVGDKKISPSEAIIAITFGLFFSIQGVVAIFGDRLGSKRLKITKLNEYNESIPYGVVAKLKSAYDKNLFDSYSVIEIKDMKDPLIVGQVDNFPNYFIIGIWGNDMDGIIEKA